MIDERDARQIAAAVLLQAVRDAQGGSPRLSRRARAWLLDEGATLAEMLDIPAGAVLDWLRRLEEEQ